MWTRRKFIRQLSLTAGGTILSADVFGGHYTKKLPVIIIGAGFSGLAAAYVLYKRKISFVVLEARDRIGGRVFSHLIDPAEKLVVELGAEWVGNSHHRIQTLCGELGLQLQNNQFDSRLIYKGKYADKDEWAYSKKWLEQFEKLKINYRSLSDLQARKMDKTDWWQYLISNGCDGDDLAIRELFDSTDFGESIRHVSAYAALGEYAESNRTNEMDQKIVGGNNRLAMEIAKKIGWENIKPEHAVAKIEQGTNVKVTCKNGMAFTGSRIICTVPAFSLRQINWQPALPAETVAALYALQYARINKNVLLYSERFWKDENFDLMTDTPGHYFYHATKGQPSGKGALISYAIGDKAPVINAQTEAWKAEMYNLSLKPGFGETRHLLEKQAGYYWGDDQYSKGAYALYGVGQWFGIQPVLQRPFLKTRFAGEHLSDAWQGFMEGAIETGEAAANG